MLERNAVEQRLHVLERIDGHADLAHLAERERMIGIHADLRGQIEGDRKARLPLRKQVAVALIGFRRRCRSPRTAAWSTDGRDTSWDKRRG